MEKKISYNKMMERVHNAQRAGVKLHGLMLDLAIDEALDAPSELQTASQAGGLSDEEVRA